MKLLSSYALACLAAQAAAATLSNKLGGYSLREHPDPVKRAEVQNYVTWDEHSLFIRGERMMIFSGEVHPFRIPVPSLWLDILQKVKALGFNCVSFYVDWALLEGKQGHYSAEGIFDLELFFEAATEAGIYLMARPGPYINAETSGGGFPGWLQRVNATLRTNDDIYLNATDNYMAHIASTIAKAQITNGGPVILYQPENEYSGSCCGVTPFPDGVYMQYVENQARNAGIVVPFINNDNHPHGYNAPGTGAGAVDIYGHDDYPLGFTCGNPTQWKANLLPTNFRTLHEEQSPSTPYALVEFQGGASEGWSGIGYEFCAERLNHEFERVFYKNNIGFGVAYLNLYMIFGGTNWGNLGEAQGYTSYDYGAAISETRNITREKYSELKLIGNFAKVSSSYLVANPGNATTKTYTNTTSLTVTPLLGTNGSASYFVVRHTDYSSIDSVNYMLSLPTSNGTLGIPQMGGSLTLTRRDSKIHVVDYDIAGTNMLYSTAEVLTWLKSQSQKILVLYGGSGEHHELAVSGSNVSVVEGPSSGISSKQVNETVVIAWDVSTTRRIVKVNDLTILLLDRNSAYNYWVPQLQTHQGLTNSTIIVNAGYLVRSATLDGHSLNIQADFNATTPIEVIGAPSTAEDLFINGKKASLNINNNSIWSTNIEYAAPEIKLPDLKNLTWKSIDTLPEILSSYDDSAWIAANHTYTNNSAHALKTPTSLSASDYGFNAGTLIYRGHFTANGNETTFSVNTQGGSAFASSVWINETYLGSWTGNSSYSSNTVEYTLPSSLESGKQYVITVVIDNMGLDENWTVGQDQMKAVRGITAYTFSGQNASAIAWKLTGNLGGEDYMDSVRGPLNEGGLYAERQGFHQPQPPSQNWNSSTPFTGLTRAGIQFYSTSFDLDIPEGWDIPMYFNIANTTSPAPAYRVQLYVNGYQYGKYVNTLGPQTSFPVPEGILNYRGTNWLALALWVQEAAGASLDGLELVSTTPVLTSMGKVVSVDQPKYQKRHGAY